jgi:hypothetical protein
VRLAFVYFPVVYTAGFLLKSFHAFPNAAGLTRVAPRETLSRPYGQERVFVFRWTGRQMEKEVPKCSNII